MGKKLSITNITFYIKLDSNRIRKYIHSVLKNMAKMLSGLSNLYLFFLSVGTLKCYLSTN